MSKQRLPHQQKPQPPTARATGSSTRIELSEHHSGPLPHPELLHAYAQILPDLPERIVAMAEREQASRHERQMQPYKIAKRGQVCGVLVVVFVLIAGVILAYLGQALAGLGVVLTALAGLIVAIQTGKAPAPPKDQT